MINNRLRGFHDIDSPTRATTRKNRRSIDLADWMVVAWVAWWSWAYVQSAVLHRFPQLKIGAAATGSSSSHQFPPRPSTHVPR